MIWQEVILGLCVVYLRQELLLLHIGSRLWSNKAVGEVHRNVIEVFFDLERGVEDEGCIWHLSPGDLCRKLKYNSCAPSLVSHPSSCI